MKIKKIITLVSATAFLMTNFTAISVPQAAAEGTGFFEDFEGYEELSDTYSVVDAMNDLYAGGWSVATDSAFTARNEADNNQKFAKIVKDGDNKVLELSTTSALGRMLDPETQTPSGSYEISFKFKPVASGKFDLTANSFNEAASVAKHNIVYSTGIMRMGHRVNSVNVPMTQVGTAENVWYNVKCIVNNDAGYYSVELYKEGVFVARRAAINYAGSEKIGFLKLSGAGATLYVDDVSITPCEQETLIYEDNFDSYNEVKLAASYLTVGSTVSEAQSRDGSSFFEGYTPWRALKTFGNSYDLIDDATRGSRVVRLGDDSATTAKEATGLILMPLDGEFLTKASQPKRGQLKLTYKFRHYSQNGYATAVDLLSTHNYGGKWDYPPQLAIQELGLGSPAVKGLPYLRTNSSPIKINQELWYDAELIFDVINDLVTITIKENSTGKEIAHFSHATNWINPASAPTFDKVKAINFRAITGSAIYIDDFKLEYYIVDPKITGSEIVITDYKGEIATDRNDVPAAVASIELPFGSEMTEESTNTGSVRIRDSKGVYLDYSPVYGPASYTIIPDGLLTPGETYTLTVPGTVENAFGRKLGSDFEYSFKVRSEYPALMTLASATITDLQGVTNGSVIDAAIEYANSSDAALNSMAFIAYYGDGMLLATSSVKPDAIGIGKMGTKTVSFTVPATSALDMSKVDKISLCLWKGFENSASYCSEIDVTAASDAETDKENPENSISKPEIKYSYTDSVLNISGTAKSDSKFLTVQILKQGNTFDMGDSLAIADADNLVFYRAQAPVKNGRYSLDVRFDTKGNTASTLLAGDYPTAIYLDDKKLDINSVYLISYQEFKDAIKELNDAAQADDFDAFKNVLNSKRSALNFNNKLLGNAALGNEIKPYFDYVKSNPLAAEKEVENSEMFNTYVVMKYLNNNEIDSISDIEELLISDGVKALCGETLTTDTKNKYFTSLISKKNIGNQAQLEKSIKEALILTSARYGNGYGELKAILEACGQEIGISGKISDEACRNLMGQTFDSAASFKTAYDNAVAALKSSSSSSSSSGSSGGVSLPVPDITSSVPEAEPITKIFNDIDNFEWAMTEILALADRKIISGVSEDRFEPSRNITREEFAKILVEALGASGSGYDGNVFADAKDSDWFVKYINIAAKLGIVNGVGNGNFGTGQSITRQDMAVMIYNALKYRNVNMTTGDFVFDDDGQIADYAKNAVSALHEMGAINGMTETTFAPRGLATRAQAAKIVYNVLKELQGGEDGNL